MARLHIKTIRRVGCLIVGQLRHQRTYLACEGDCDGISAYTFARIPIHFGERQKFARTLANIRTPARSDFEWCWNMRAWILIPPGDIPHREHIRLIPAVA